MNTNNAIPDFDHNLVIPPYIGSPTLANDLSPYKCSTIDLCRKFATSPKRIEILEGFIAFRKKLNKFGLKDGFQWIDGSFLENVELREQRSPNDLDLVTVYWGYEQDFQEKMIEGFKEFIDTKESKRNYLLDHYSFDASFDPRITVEYSRYWIQLFSHNRDAVWKGMLQIPLNTAENDAEALQYLNSLES